MSTTTANLGLFKYDTTNPTDLASAFNINKALNANWDKIDTAMAGGGLPDQTDKAGYLLTTDGTEASWGETTNVFPIVDYGQDVNIWYKIYARDFTGYRWCIQGGLYYKGSTIAGDNEITFPKTFKDINYTVVVIPIHSDAALDSRPSYEKYTLRTNTSFTFHEYSALFGYQWVAFGYIADDEE